MEKIKSTVFMPLLFLISAIAIYSQDLKVIPGDTIISGTSDSELILYTQVVNISSSAQTIFLKRKENNLPEGWTSSLCFGGSCFSPQIDSVLSSLLPLDTLEASVHFSPDKINPGTAHVQIQIGTTNNPEERITINLTASTIPVAVNEQVNATSGFSLMQNYPNPFNPTTNFEFRIANRGFVSLKVYDLLGKEAATIVKEELTPGYYHFPFSAEGMALPHSHFPLTGGIYFYQLKVNENVITKKMVLAK